MRNGFLFGLSKEVRGAARADAGDRVEVRLELDRAQRNVEVPPALAAALASDARASAAWEGLAYTHRKEFVRWIEEAKRDETSERRATKALEMLRAGENRS